MKTTDGKELKEYSYYYLENGQVVTLVDWMETRKGIMKYLVTPFYEGEAMGCSGAGGEHSEYDTPYEHEGLEMIVNSLFTKIPIEQKALAYKELEEKLIAIKKFSKESEEDLRIIKTQISNGELEIELIEEKFVTSYNKSEVITKANEELQEKVNEKTTELHNLEDSIDTLSKKDKDEELGYLRKRDFELTCLENGGVDNWEWYGEALEAYNERYPDE